MNSISLTPRPPLHLERGEEEDAIGFYTVFLQNYSIPGSSNKNYVGLLHVHGREKNGCHRRQPKS